MNPRLLGGLTPARFLQRHWQKEPLLVRGAFPGFQDPVTPDELAGLALEDGIHARLVMEKGARRPWQMEHGPFTGRRLSGLPRSHWTLLVSNVDRWVDEAAALLDHFSFVPHWRLDDLMVSFAPPGGSVGPHVDSYDVFLIQGQGRRRWGIQKNPDMSLVAGVDLKILKRFRPEEEWVLEPGDMLYLPPGVAHHGVALEDCLTYSVGFRAPAQRDLVLDLFNLPHNLSSLVETTALYGDPGLEPQASPGEITPAALARVAALVRGPLERDDVLGRWFAGVVTRPDAGVPPLPRKRRSNPAKLAAQLRAGQGVWRGDDLRVAYVAPKGGSALFFFAGGEEQALPLPLLPLVQAVCAARKLSGRELLAALPARGAARQAGLAWLAELFALGVLVWAERKA